MKTNPRQAGCQCEGCKASAPGVCRMPGEPQSDHCKAQWHDQLNNPDRDSVSQDFATLFFRLNELPSSEAKKYCNPGSESATEAARESLPAAFKKGCQRGQRKQTAIASGKHSAEKSDNQDEVLLK